MEYWKTFAKRSLVLVTTRDEVTGEENIMPASWCTKCSNEPPLVATSIDHSRHTHGLLERNRYFGLAVPSEEFDYSFIGSNSGRDCDKFKEARIERFYGTHNIPIIKGALLNMVMEKTDTFPVGDHTLFIGKVLEVKE